MQLGDGDCDDEDLGWDSLFLLNQGEKLGASSSMASHSDFSPSYPLLMENENPFHLVRFVSDSKHPCDRNEGISQLVGSLVHPESAQISNPGCPSIFLINEEREPCERVSKVAAEGSYSHGKRRIPSLSPLASDDKREIPGEKRPKMEESDLHNKPVGKGAKENSVSGEAPKENVIHVRARRGQATNSHSLAERVRREKISERMRLLQEIVPGCNKITGKAVMLDEIINYVQSLQQQVEFLSMKLATVYPELNLDFERTLSKEILHPRTGMEAIVGFGSGLAPSDPTHYGAIPPQSMAPPFSRTESDDEIRSLLGVGFNLSSGFENSG